MTLFRPEVTAMLYRAREVISAAAVGLTGAMMVAAGGYVLVPIGSAVILLAAGWALVTLRRLRFQQPVDAPGVVEVDEGQIGYFGPNFGGFVALAAMADIRLTDVSGKRHWRLKTDDGQVLMIPVAATGAERLFDAFAVLPGADMAAMSAALTSPPSLAPVWTRRPAQGAAGSGPDAMTRIAPHHHENS